jgi:hypothetical protein
VISLLPLNYEMIDHRLATLILRFFFLSIIISFQPYTSHSLTQENLLLGLRKTNLLQISLPQSFLQPHLLLQVLSDLLADDLSW